MQQVVIQLRITEQSLHRRNPEGGQGRLKKKALQGRVKMEFLQDMTRSKAVQQRVAVGDLRYLGYC